MGQVIVERAEVREGRIASLTVSMPNLPPRDIDRETALAWMADGHSFLPRVGSGLGRALQLVEVGEPPERFVRDDHEATAADALGSLTASQA